MVDTSTKSGKTAFGAALFTVVVGISVLVGWFFDLDLLKRMVPGLVAMNPVTAIAFILTGVSLALFLKLSHGKDQKSRTLVLTARLLALAVTLIGLARLAAIFMGWNMGVDQWLFTSQLPYDHPFPNHMSPNAALNFLLFGGALQLVDVENRFVRLLALSLIIVVGLGSFLAILGYAYGIESFYRFGVFIPMALPTGIMFSVLLVAFFLCQTDHGLLGIFVGDSAGGAMARRLLPAIVLVPAVFGWLELQGETAGIFDSKFGNAVFALANIVALAFLIAWSAWALFNADVLRKQAEESLRLLNSAVLQSKEAILITDANLDLPGPTIIFINPAFTKMTGYTREEALGKTPRILQGPLTDKAVLSRLRKDLERGEIFGGELINYRKDGTKFDLEWQIAPLRDTDDKITHFVAIQRDITESKMAEEVLRMRQTELQALFDLIPAMIWFKDMENRILRVNERVSHSAGKSVAEMEGKSMYEIYPQEAAGYYADDLEVIASRVPKLGIVEMLQDKEGKKLWIQTDKVPVCDKDGTVNGIIVMAQDITEQKRIEARFRRLTDSDVQGVVFWKISGEIIGANDSFLRLVRHTREDLEAGRLNWMAMTPPEGADRDRQALEEITLRGACTPFEKEFICKDGARVPVLVGAAVFEDSPQEGICFVLDLTERRKTESKLRASEELFRLIVDAVKDYALLMLDPNGIVISWNAGAERIKGYEASEIIGKHFSCFYTPEAIERKQPDSELEIAVKQGRYTEEGWRVRKDGSRFLADVVITPVYDDTNTLRGFAKVTRDVTLRKEIEARLFQSQKMETVGKLTGGIAHEFNSILTAIIGQSEFLLDELPANSPSAQRALEINHAADRAANLTRQLLAYGRKQTLQPRILDLNSILAGMEDSLRLLMARETEVCLVPAAGLKSVKVDAGQMEQVILSMAINAAEAMPNGGKLTLETANVTLAEDYVRLFPDAKTGDYAMLAITDTGMGMSPETQARIFEPFFTTKHVGQGTGLGLSTCHGIIHQSGGHISVVSAPAQGSTFKIYLPQIEQMTKPSSAGLDSPDLPPGTETILFVEGDPALLEMAETLLGRLGYTVLTAATGGEALRHAGEHGPGPIDLVFADFAMSDMSVHELSGQMRVLYPQVRVLLAQASNESADIHPTGSKLGMTFLSKPFSPFALACKIREMLDQPTDANSKTAQKM